MSKARTFALGGGLPLFTELPRRRVFSAAELPAYRVLGNPYTGLRILIQGDRGKAYFLALLRSYRPCTLLHVWMDMQPVNHSSTPGRHKKKQSAVEGGLAADRGGKCTPPTEEKLQNERIKEERVCLALPWLSLLLCITLITQKREEARA